jgi:activator of HSP90 ATPase
MSGLQYPQHIRRLVESFSCLHNSRLVPLTSDAEYMQLTELRFLVKNVRELSAIQMYSSYSKCDTVTTTCMAPSSSTSDASVSTSPLNTATVMNIKDAQPSSNEIKCTAMNAQGIDQKIKELDLFLTDVCVLINSRLNASRQSTGGLLHFF